MARLERRIARLEASRTPWWREVGLGLLAGAALAALPALLLGLAGFPEAGRTLAALLGPLAVLVPVGLLLRVLLVGLHGVLESGVPEARRRPAARSLWPSRLLLVPGAVSAGAYLALAVASGLARGDWTP